MWGWLGYIGGWRSDEKRLSNVDNPKAPSEVDSTFWKDWEWVMSSSEEILFKHSQHQLESTLNELSRIRGASLQFRIRPKFLNSAVSVLSAMKTEDRIELQLSLDAPKRSKVITDVIHACEEEWKSKIKDAFFQDRKDWSRFDQLYGEQSYSKNTVGVLREVGFQASHGHNGTLTPRVLADISWSMWNALRGSVRGSLERDLLQDELYDLADIVCGIQEPLVSLWLSTIRISKSGHSREGVLVGKWKEQDVATEKRLVALRGCADERYESHISKSSSAQDECKRSVADLRSTIGSKLIMRAGGGTR